MEGTFIAGYREGNRWAIVTRLSPRSWIVNAGTKWSTEWDTPSYTTSLQTRRFALETAREWVNA